MRKIGSKYQEEKRRKRNQFVLGFVLIFVMFFSVIGYSFQGTVSHNNIVENSNYNGFEFIEQNGFWILNQNNVNLIFRYSPNEVPNINSKLKNLNNYNGKPLYIFSESTEAESEIRTNLFQSVERIQNACLEECDKNLPIKTCEDNFIIIKEGDEKIVQENNCVFITGKIEDLTKLADEFLFKILEIKS
jgi:hypothetical protein|tara:strand:+ start:330 stop:896 length:567 start_codon:yes stop_codon:yes gene_type:complete